QRLQEQATALSTQLLFFGLEWAALDDERAEPLLAAPELERYRHFLGALRRYRPHLLTELEEKILAEKSVSGVGAWSRLYSELLSGLRVPYEGEEISLEVALAKQQDADREIRRAAAEAITAALEPGL